MSLKADMNADISEVFLNLEDFGERHVVDGKEIIAVFYDEELIPGNRLRPYRQKADIAGGHGRHATAAEAGSTLEVDDRVYLVAAWREELGMVRGFTHGKYLTTIMTIQKALDDIAQWLRDNVVNDLEFKVPPELKSSNAAKYA